MDLTLFYKIPLAYWTQSYWRDEVFRVLMAKYSFVDIIRLTYNDGQPPLYYFLLKFWINIFGDSEIATRTLSLIFFDIMSNFFFTNNVQAYFISAERNKREIKIA